MNKGLIVGIVVVAVVLVGGGLWMMYGANTQTSQYNTTQNGAQNNQNVATGTLYMSFTDAAVNMGSVSAINMTVDKIYVHSQAQGWVTVSTAPQTFSLLALKASGKAGLMAKLDVPTDTYDQVWFHMSNVMVTESGKTAKQATVPSADFKMQGVVKVTQGAASSAKLDVLADQSIHKTDKGEFIFTPVVNFEGKSNAVINVDTNNLVMVLSGTVDSNTSAGMDASGEVKANFKLDSKSNLQINGGLINIK